MEVRKNIKEYLLNTKNPYKLIVGDMTVMMQYSKNDKKFEKCILNILKEKARNMDSDYLAH